MTFPTRTAVTLAVVAASAPVCAACSSLLPPAHPPRPRPTASLTRHAAAPATPGLAALLPISPAQLRDAAALAARFTNLYATHPRGQSPRAWLAQLRPMATRQLAAALARTAATPALWPHPRPTAARAGAPQIRDLTPRPVTVTIGVRRTGSAHHGSLTFRYAVTVTRQPGGGWAVYDIEPATAGNTG